MTELQDSGRFNERLRAVKRRHSRSLDVGDDFDEALNNMAETVADCDEDVVPRTPGTDNPDLYGSEKKPDNNAWDHVPVTEEEKAVYYGLHIHVASNPLGLHSHVMGGTPSGAHTHGPQNPLGQHHHKEKEEGGDPKGNLIDGAHYHGTTENMPTGSHRHQPENFG